MANELDNRRETALQKMMDVEFLPDVQLSDFSMTRAEKLPMEKVAALGVAFEPLTSAVQTMTSGEGQSGIYFVNTHGKTMFRRKNSSEYIGSLKNSEGAVGGGQATMTQLACNPTMLFMAAALMNIEKKLDEIKEAQQDILDFLEQKEQAAQKGNLNVLTDILNNYKYNWNNEKYKTNKHIQVQEIKRDAEKSILFYRELIAKQLRKRTFLHSDQEVSAILNKVQAQFKNYQLALYLYAFAAFLEVMLLENFDSAYLNSVSSKIEEYSLEYRVLYTECYNVLEQYSESSIQTRLLSGIAVVSKTMGEAIAKVPVISNSQLDENLIEAGGKLKAHTERRASKSLKQLVQARGGMVRPFIENIQTINMIYNEPTSYMIDKENIYVLHG